MKNKNILEIVPWIIISLFIYLWINFLIYSVVNISNLWYLSLSVTIIINYLFLRYIILLWVYEWQFPFQRIALYVMCFQQVKHTKIVFLKMKEAIITLLEINGIIQRNHIISIKICCFTIKSLIHIYQNIFIKYGRLSFKQKEFLDSLTNLKKDMDSSGFSEYFENLNTQGSRIKCKWKLTSMNPIDNSYYKYQLLKINFALRIILNIFDEYLCEGNNYFCFLDKIKTMITNDSLSSIEKLHIEFLDKFSNYEIEEHQHNKNNFVIIKGKKVEEESELINKEESNKKTLLIICGPNGGPYEVNPISKLTFFLDKNIDLLLWNYRGYGLSKGKTTFNRAKDDVIGIYDKVSKEYDYDKIGVYGYSIGGVSAFYLAANRNIDLIISDRNLSSFSEAAYGLKNGIPLWILYNFFLIRSDKAINNYVHSKCSKIIICSPVDELIMCNATLKSGISQYVIQNYIEGNEDKKKNILEVILGKERATIFVENMINIMEYIENSKGKNKPEKGFAVEQSLMININGKQNKKENALFSNIEELNQNLLPVNESSKSDSNENSLFMNIELINEGLKTFIGYFKSLCTENITYPLTIHMSKRRTNLMVKHFFNNLFVWGCRPLDDKNDENYIDSVESKLFSPLNTLPLLTRALNELTTIVEKLKHTEHELASTVKSLVKMFHIILSKYPQSKPIINEQSQIIFRPQKTEKSLLNEGNITPIDYLNTSLIRLCGGHNGLHNSIEQDILSYYMKRYNFI